MLIILVFYFEQYIDRMPTENELTRQAQILSTAIANEGKPGEKYDDYLTSLLSSLGASYSAGYTGGSGGGGGSGNQRR